MATVPDQFLIIKVNNLPDLIKSKGGAAGALAFNYVPQTITNTVYSQMKDQLKSKMKEQGVDVDVSIVSNPSPSWVDQPTSELWIGMGISAAVLGIGLALWKVLKK